MIVVTAAKQTGIQTMKSILLILFSALMCTAFVYGQQADPVLEEGLNRDITISGRNSNFLVKLTSSMSATS
ncbi:MAG: hypothetical protein ACR2QU_01500, partial [Gammaproteobacteria bacterium]